MGRRAEPGCPGAAGTSLVVVSSSAAGTPCSPSEAGRQVGWGTQVVFRETGINRESMGRSRGLPLGQESVSPLISLIQRRSGRKAASQLVAQKILRVQ